MCINGLREADAQNMTAKPDVWTDVTLDDGTQVKIRDFLPFAEREEAAAEYAARALVVSDEENGITYESYRWDVEWMYLKVKYYTNIDVEGIPAEDVFDYAERSGLGEKINNIAAEDCHRFYYTGEKMMKAASTQIRERGSLSYFIRNRFDYLLDPDKTAEMFARATGLNEQMIDIMNAARERDTMKGAQKKPTVIPGGLSLAKK